MEIKRNRQELNTFLSLSGRLDTMTSNELASTPSEVFEEGFENLVFDLLGLDYISSAGLCVFLSAQKRIYCRRIANEGRRASYPLYFCTFFSSLVNSMIDGLCKDVSETKQYLIHKGVSFLSYIGIIRHPKKHILPPPRFRDVYYRFCAEKIYTIEQNSFEIPLRIWFVKCVSN